MKPTAARRARQAVAGGTAARRDQGHTPGLASGCVGRGARRSLWTRATKMCFLGLAATGVSSAGGQQLAPAAKGARGGRRMMPLRRGETWQLEAGRGKKLMMGLLSVTAVGSGPVSFDRRSQCSTESTTEALGIPRESHLK